MSTSTRTGPGATPGAPAPAPAATGRARRRTATSAGERHSTAVRVLATGAVAVATVYFLMPVWWMVVAATKSSTSLFTTPGFSFADPQLLQNLRELSTYDDGIFWRWVLNTVVYSVVGSVLTVLVCAACGYALAMFEFRGRKVLLGAVLASMLVPGTVLAQPTYLLVVELGLNNTYAGVLLPSMVYPFGVLLCTVFARSSIPVELLEAARLDGAGELRIFVAVGLRLMTTGLVTVLLFAFLGSWNNYLLPLMVLTDAELMPLTVGLTGWSQASITIPGLQVLVVAGSLVSVVPVIGVFIALQRYWRSGLTAGGVRF
ncbi:MULTISPECIES: carbohydrate ABC transporter permease [Kineococcus]|uniref:carbohydrate ABC transporter permease n=1 Tax=unclassified Kineococcus TaxID=2621656 RepID=UPI001F569F73|nr:carbohydrate ABC transporter permease [Kineococcus sp. TRM81007]MCI2237999.1 carbohydrate ABC transporter permease [Kineococcus sp. TRM81007]MCI3926013.1 carbohydrate ABC transporter permease [Paenibacillus sp. TRM 82003]